MIKARMSFNPDICKDLQEYSKGNCGIEKLLGGDVTIEYTEDDDGEKFTNYLMQDTMLMEDLEEYRLGLKDNKAKEKEAPLPTKV